MGAIAARTVLTIDHDDNQHPRTCLSPFDASGDFSRTKSALCYSYNHCSMASLIAILDLKGKPLIQRSYRDDVPPSYIEKFLPIVLELEEEGQQVTPCFSREGVNYMHIRHSNLYRE